jgi:hypothetical protein
MPIEILLTCEMCDNRITLPEHLAWDETFAINEEIYVETVGRKIPEHWVVLDATAWCPKHYMTV